jgi:cytochrome oxidase assembly protein ShyY1
VPSDLAVRPAARVLAPRYWGVHLLMVVAVVATVLLGRWQYDVWHAHRTDSAASVTREAPVPLDSVLAPDAAYPGDALGRPVTVAGTWDPAHTWYIANRERGGRSGYWALTLVTTPSGSQIPVVRGWLPALDDPPAAPTGRAALVGLLQPSEDTGAPQQDIDADDVLAEVNITDLLQRTSKDLYSGYVIATDRAVPGAVPPATGTAGLVTASAEHLPGADASTGLRNLLYAFQWWVFGAFAIFMWWRWLSEDVLGRPRRGAASGGG